MKAKEYKNGNNEIIAYQIKCLGCDSNHFIHVQHPDNNIAWGFNQDIERPTFSPSLLVRSGHYVPDQKPDENCWCTYNKECIEKGEKPAPFECMICHSFINDGKIQYLGDCTHKLAGQTIELPDF